MTQPIELQVVSGETSGLITIKNNIITLSDDTTFEQWKIGLRYLLWSYRKAELGIADYISFAVKKWGREQVDQTLELLSTEATLVKSAIAVNSIPKQLRFDNLDGDHFVELARADISKQEMIRWARIASEQNLTPMQLRFSIIEGEVIDRAAAKQQGTGVYTVQGIRQSFDIWLRRVGGLGGVLDMDMDHKIEIMEELESICEFGLQLHHHIVQQQNQAELEHATESNPA